MSCDSRRTEYFRSLSANPALQAALSVASADEATTRLHAIYDAGRNQTDPDARRQRLRDVLAKAAWLTTQADASERGISLYPHRSKSGLPGIAMQRGWLAVSEALKSSRAAGRATARCAMCGQFIGVSGHQCPYPEPAKRIVPVPSGSMAAQVAPVLKALDAAGGQCFFVGGVGRDLLLGQPAKDADIEVHGLRAERLLAVAQQFGTATIPKNGFPVVKLTAELGGERIELDLAMPRTEEKTGQGRQGFTTYADPNLGLYRASERRDLTIGAISGRYDPATGTMELIDPHGGMADLENRILRAVSDKSFADDPTRVLRMMQFAARFRMRVDPDTARLAAASRHEYEAGKVSTSEQWAEWHKLAAKGVSPSHGLQALHDSGWLEVYPHLAALDGVEQDSYWHPEGDVWTHTKYVADAAAAVAERDGLTGMDRDVLVLAAICHDMAKPQTTAERWETAPAQADGAAPEPGRGPEWEPDPAQPGAWRRRRITSYGHEEAGEPLAEAFLRQIGAPNEVIAQVKPLVRLHLRHIPLVRLQREIAALEAEGRPTAGKQRELDRLIRRLAVQVAPASLAQLGRLIEADMSGRPPLPPQNPFAEILPRAEALQADQHAPENLLKGHGRTLIAEGLTRPGPAMGDLLRRAYEAQLDGEFEDLDGAMDWVRNAVRDESRSIA